jgi:hypothetical protein
MEDRVMKIIGITCAIALSASVAAAEPEASAAQAPEPAGATIRHLPLNEIEEGDVRLRFEVESPDRAGAIVVVVLPEGARQPFQVFAKRTFRGYEARLGAAQIPPPGFTYYVVERMPDGRERPVFASKTAPHRVHVLRAAARQAELDRLSLRAGQRSVVLASGELVDFGDRRLASGAALSHDRYYRLETGYTYSFLSTVEDVRLSLVRVRGEAADYATTTRAPTITPTEPGIDYGRAMITLLASDVVRLRAAVLLGASQLGFEYGGGGSLVLGDPRATNLEAGFEAMTTLGATARLRLGFLATPRVPMGASVEVTNFPVGADAGVRLLYDVAYRFGAVTTLALRAGYQGRTSVSGGPAVALAYEYGF